MIEHTLQNTKKYKNPIISMMIMIIQKSFPPFSCRFQSWFRLGYTILSSLLEEATIICNPLRVFVVCYLVIRGNNPQTHQYPSEYHILHSSYNIVNIFIFKFKLIYPQKTTTKHLLLAFSPGLSFLVILLI